MASDCDMDSFDGECYRALFFYMDADRAPDFVYKCDLDFMEDFICLSPEYVILYNGRNNVINPHLAQYGLSIPGEAWLMKNDAATGKSTDIELDILDSLCEIVSQDNIKRQEFLNRF